MPKIMSKVPLRTKFSPKTVLLVKVSLFFCVTSALLLTAVYSLKNPETIAKREIEWLARDYYENYYYPKLVASLPQERLEEVLTKYQEHGFEATTLKQLLLFDNGRHQQKQDIFTQDQYFCDDEASYTTIKPKPPFAKQDYTIEIKLNCLPLVKAH